jgi:hypothetical protein
VVHHTADPVPRAVRPAGLQDFHPGAGHQAGTVVVHPVVPVAVRLAVPVAVRLVVPVEGDDEECF